MKSSRKPAASTTKASTKASSNVVPKEKEKGAAGDVKPLSAALQYCALHVKDFMNDQQKANTYLKCGKHFMTSAGGDYLAAVECFNEGINWNPIVSLYTHRASAHKSLNMWTEAYFDYSFAIRMEPENASFFCQRGLCLTRLKRIALAVEDLDQACILDPVPLHFYSRGTILADSGQNEQAIVDFTQALSYGDNISRDLKLRATYRRALSNFELHRYDESLKDLAQLLQQDSNSVAPRALMGRAYKMMENLKRADEQLTFVIELEPRNPEHYAERGDIRFRTGDKSLMIEAVYDFDKAVRLHEEKIEKMRDSLSRPASRAQLVGGLRQAVANASSSSQTASKTATATEGSAEKDEDDENQMSSHTHGEGGEEERKDELPDDDKGEQAAPLEDDGRMMDGEDDAEGNEDDEEIGEHGEHDEDGDNDEHEDEHEGGEHDGSEKGGVAAPDRAGSAVGKKRGKTGSRNGRPSRAVEAWQIDEAEKLLADAFFRRGQAKLMLAKDELVIEAALNDALSSIHHSPEDDDYQLLVAVCYVRLKKLEAAMQVLQTVLARSPHNEKALYQFAFCQRTRGRQKDAIEGLTKIISHSAFSENEGETAMAVPLERVLETRGTLFHEIQAHTFALADLGRAVAMDPERAGNYYLRGDCHSKLGNYELAISDFVLAEEKGFPDLVSLWSSRGMVYRLLGNSDSARRDFESSLLALPEDEAHRSERIRLSSFRALCFIDKGMYNAGYDILVSATSMVELMERRVELGLPPFLQEKDDSGEGDNPQVSFPLVENAVDRPLLVSLRKLKWTLLYHSALALHMQKKFLQASEALQQCISVQMRPCAPDDFVLGAALFFLGVQHCQNQALADAEESLRSSLESKWGQVDKNQAVIIFALGKLFQQQLRHDVAIDYFTRSIAIDANNAHAFFRRAWSYKSTNDYISAGSDFETAKHLRHSDPNFQVDYKRISTFEFMSIESEPDLVLPMPVLVPAPGGPI